MNESKIMNLTQAVEDMNLTQAVEDMNLTQAVEDFIKEQRPVFRNSDEKLAYVVHAAFIVSGFSLHTTGGAAVSAVAAEDKSSVKSRIENWNNQDRDVNFTSVYFYPIIDTSKVFVQVSFRDGNMQIETHQSNGSFTLTVKRLEKFVAENEEISYNYKNLDELVCYLDHYIIDGYIPKSDDDDGKPGDWVVYDSDENVYRIYEDGDPHDDCDVDPDKISWISYGLP